MLRDSKLNYKNTFYPSLLLLATLISLAASPVDPQAIREASSVTEVHALLEGVIREVKAMLAQANPDFKFQQAILEQVDQVANRAHDLSSWREEEKKGVAAKIFQEIASLFQQIYEANTAAMEKLQSETEGDERALEALYTSERWKQKEFISSLARYRASKTRYYWALALEKGDEERTRLLREAILGFSPYTMAYQGPDLLSYCRLGRALCYRELGNYEKAMEELEEISKGQDPSTILIQARTERIGIHLHSQRYRQAMEEANQLLTDLEKEGTQDSLADRIRFMKLEALFPLFAPEGSANRPQPSITPNVEESPPTELEGYHHQALEIMRQLIKKGEPWPDRVSSLVVRKLGAPDRIKGVKLSSLEGWILAENLFAERKYEEALPLYLLVLKSAGPEDGVRHERVHLQLGLCYYNLKQFEEAVQRFTALLSRAPDSPEASTAAYWRYRAYKALYSDSWPPPYLEALQYYVSRFPQHPSVSEVRYQLGQFYRQKGERLRAAEELRLVADDSRYVVDARFLAFRCYVDELESLKESKENQARVLYAKASKTKEQFSAALLTRLQANPDQEEKATLEGFSAYATLLSARLHSRGPTKDYAQSLDELRDFETLHPRQRDLFLPASLLRIESLQELERLEEAKEVVERLIREHGGHPKAGQVFGQLAGQFQTKAQQLLGQGKEKAALECEQIAQMIKNAK